MPIVVDLEPVEPGALGLSSVDVVQGVMSHVVYDVANQYKGPESRVQDWVSDYDDLL